MPPPALDLPAVRVIALLALAGLAVPVGAQNVAVADSVSMDVPAADSTRADSVAVPPAPPALDGLLRRAADHREAHLPITLLQNTLERSVQPVRYAFRSGLRITLPPGWDGPESAVEPADGAVLYTFQNTTPGHPLAGVTVRLERVQGLNALLRERWMRGQTSHGYHGTQPVGPAAAPMPGFAVEVTGPGQSGAVVFSQRDSGMWAVQVVAPAALWASRRDAVLALLTGITLP